MNGAVGTEQGAKPPRASWLPDAIGAVALSIYAITASVAFAALVFTGPAVDGRARGAATFLVASGVVTVAVGMRSQFPIAFGVVQDTAAIVLVPIVGIVVANGSNDPVRDVFVALALSSLLTGVAMWAIGRARLGAAARFMPTTVVAGFLAGTGWLLFKGGFDVMTDRSLGLGDLDDLVGIDLAKFWLPGLALGLFIAAVPLIPKLSPVVSSIATIASIGVYFAVVAAASSFSAVETGGWLLGPFPDRELPQFVVSDVANADWSALGAGVGQIGVVIILSVLGVLLNISGIQSVVKRRVDVDFELRNVGALNVLVSTFGGLVGFHGLGDSSLADRLGVTRRHVALVVGGATGLVGFLGVTAMGNLPTFVAGGLLIGAGLGLLVEWVEQLRSTAGRSDRAVSVLILLVIAFVGILDGIVVGIVAACLFFVVRYSRIDAIRVASTGLDVRSVVARTPDEVERLDELGGRIAVYELHGSLFFGSVSNVSAAVRQRLARPDAPIDTVILDFARVSGFDSSAFEALGELSEDIEAAGVGLTWSALDGHASSALERTPSGASGAFVVANLDAALEHGEDRLLERHRVDRSDADVGAEPYSDDLLSWFETVSHGAGDEIVREGEPSNALAVLVSGAVHVSRRDGTGGDLRLRTLRPGAIIGEIGFLTGERRSATVTAETDVELRVLSTAAHQRLRVEQPALALELYDRVLASTADRAAAIHRSLTQALR